MESLGWYAIGLNVYALALIYLRSWLYRVPVYRPMVKNFLLSVLPLLLFVMALVVAVLVSATIGRPAAIVVAVLGFLVWLLALPNSGYLITELNLNHRREDETVPLWYDIISVLSFAMSGVVNSALGILAAQVALVLAIYGDSNAEVDGPIAVAAVVVLTLLVSIGIYLGRYLRLNSWDVRSPQRMRAKVVQHFDSRRKVADFLVFCVTHTVFLLLVYGLLVGPMLTQLAKS